MTMSGERPWHHTETGFRNPPGSPHMRPDAATYWRFIGRMMRYGARRWPLPPGHLREAAAAKAEWRALDGAPGLLWLGHAAFLLRLGGKTILLDPYLGEVAGPVRSLSPRRFVPPALAVEDLPPVDLLVISHNHYDHLCIDTLRRLPDRGSITVIVPLKLGAFFRRFGFREIVELDWHDTYGTGGLRVSALPAIHWSKRTAFDTNRTLWAGFALEADGLRLYFAGDTAYGPVFRDIGERYGPFDFGLVPIGAYEPRAIMAGHHANPEEAVMIGRDIGAKRLVAMHWGTVMLTDEHPFEPPGRFRMAAAQSGYAAEDAWLMAVGETRPLKPWPGN